MNDRDLLAIERAASDAEIRKWFDLHTRSPADYLAAKREAWAEGTGASFAICDATRPNVCLGQVFIERDDDGRGSVGYWLLEDGRGKGRATRAVRLMASWALPEMRLGRLQLHTDPENITSQRVAERAGFTREGVLRAYNGRRDGTRADAVVYSLLPQDPAPTYFGASTVELPRVAPRYASSAPSLADGAGSSSSS
jgi:RimJ/RimL family protein N-acetyltransferase